MKRDRREDHVCCVKCVVDDDGSSLKSSPFIFVLVGWGGYKLSMHTIDYQKVLLNNQM